MGLYSVERNTSGINPAFFGRQTEATPLNRGVRFGMALQMEASMNQKRMSIVGKETLPWLNRGVNLESLAVPTAQTECDLASMSHTNGLFSRLETELTKEQIRELRAVARLEIVNFMNQDFEPDQTLNNVEFSIPPIHVVNHTTAGGRMNIALVRRRGAIENSSFFFTAFRAEDAGEFFAELGKYGYELVENDKEEQEVELLAA